MGGKETKNKQWFIGEDQVSFCLRKGNGVIVIAYRHFIVV